MDMQRKMESLFRKDKEFAGSLVKWHCINGEKVTSISGVETYSVCLEPTFLWRGRAVYLKHLYLRLETPDLGIQFGEDEINWKEYVKARLLIALCERENFVAVAETCKTLESVRVLFTYICNNMPTYRHTIYPFPTAFARNKLRVLMPYLERFEPLATTQDTKMVDVIRELVGSKLVKEWQSSSKSEVYVYEDQEHLVLYFGPEHYTVVSKDTGNIEPDSRKVLQRMYLAQRLSV